MAQREMPTGEDADDRAIARLNEAAKEAEEDGEDPNPEGDEDEGSEVQEEDEGDDGESEEGGSEEEEEERERPSRKERRRERYVTRVRRELEAEYAHRLEQERQRVVAEQEANKYDGPSVATIDAELENIRTRRKLLVENYNLRNQSGQATQEDYQRTITAQQEMGAQLQKLEGYKVQRITQIALKEQLKSIQPQGQQQGQAQYTAKEMAEMQDLYKRYEPVTRHPDAWSYTRKLYEAKKSIGRTDSAKMAEEAMTAAAEYYGLQVVNQRARQRVSRDARQRRHTGVPTGGRSEASESDEGGRVIPDGVTDKEVRKMANAFGSHLRRGPKDAKQHLVKSLKQRRR